MCFTLIKPKGNPAPKAELLGAIVEDQEPKSGSDDTGEGKDRLGRLDLVPKGYRK